MKYLAINQEYHAKEDLIRHTGGGSNYEYQEYIDQINLFQLEGRNLKDIKTLEKGFECKGTTFVFDGKELPVYIASYIDNG